MKDYIKFCLLGKASIPERKRILEQKRSELLEKIAVLQSSIDYIDRKQGFYDDVLTGKIKYRSNLIDVGNDD
ncbi:MAG: hypothetical protein ACOX8M_01995 [Marvinbryantia sp.]